MWHTVRVATVYGLLTVLLAVGLTVAQRIATGLHDGYVLGPGSAYAAVYEPTTVRVATYNALGYSHTAPGGDEPGHLGGVRRTDLMYRLFLRHRIGLAAVQEFQGPQRREWRRVAGGTYGLYCPATPHSAYDGQNCLAWRTADWALVSRQTIVLPYYHWARVRYPIGVFQNRHTGAVLVMDSVHNPSTNARYGNNYAKCLRAWGIEAQDAQPLKMPAVLAGDRNATAARYLPHRPPTYRAAGQRGIDWLVGRYVVFTGYASVRGSLVSQATDHPLVYADVRF